MTNQQRNIRRGITYPAALALALVSNCTGRWMKADQMEKDLASKVAGNSIVINDENLGRAELIDIDQNGSYDSLTIFPSTQDYPSRYRDRCRAEWYVKSRFVSRSPQGPMKVVVVSSEDFDKFIAMSKVPMPRDSLLNAKQGYIAEIGRSFPEFGSYSSLFSPKYLEDRNLAKTKSKN